MASKAVTLMSSATYSATVAATGGSAVSGMDYYRSGSFVSVITGEVGAGSFTLDCTIQAYIGDNWTDVARFAQQTGDSVRVLWGVGRDINASNTIEEAQSTGAMTVSTKRSGPWGTQLRAYYVIAVTGVYSFTWYVKGVVVS